MIIKFGFDPTGKSIHLGRTVPLLVLKDLQDKGHTIVLVVGDYTAQIGDPSDKLGKRPELGRQVIDENARLALPLIWRILDKKKTQVRLNSEWWNIMDFGIIFRLLKNFTIQQMIQRRNFSTRIKGKEPVFIQEMLYPIMQGYDSYHLDADMEIGGEDQIFNMNIGRDIQKIMGNEPQEVVTVPLIPGTDGEKMSTSKGNVINIDEEPRVMFDKVMSIRDEVASLYGENCLFYPFKFEGGDIRKYKIELANRIVRMYNKDWKFIYP